MSAMSAMSGMSEDARVADGDARTLHHHVLGRYGLTVAVVVGGLAAAVAGALMAGAFDATPVSTGALHTIFVHDSRASGRDVVDKTDPGSGVHGAVQVRSLLSTGVGSSARQQPGISTRGAGGHASGSRGAAGSTSPSSGSGAAPLPDAAPLPGAAPLPDVTGVASGALPGIGTRVASDTLPAAPALPAVTSVPSTLSPTPTQPPALIPASGTVTPGSPAGL